MLKKIQDTAKARCDHKLDLDDFEASIPPEVLETWRKAVVDWEHDPNSPNPYKSDAESRFILM